MTAGSKDGDVAQTTIMIDNEPVDLAADIAFTLSDAGQLRREDREVAYAREIQRLQAALPLLDDAAVERACIARWSATGWEQVRPTYKDEFRRDMRAWLAAALTVEG